MTIPKHRQVSAWETDAACFNASRPSVVESYWRQLLNENSNVKCRAKVMAAMQTNMFATDGVLARRKAVMLDAPMSCLRCSVS